tara:strand:- start:410 stop:895 length:486 start_codon:yes stop_codon:yes gene_type:complete
MNTENKSFTSKNIKDLWQTPIKLFNKLNNEFNFTHDVASSKENKLCNNFITLENDALSCEWGLSNWCNPPYSNIMPWVNKAIIENKKGKVVVMLVPSDTSVKWFKKAFDTCDDIRFISGRISFINSTTQKPVSGNNKGSVLLIWCNNKPIKISLLCRSKFI